MKSFSLITLCIFLVLNSFSQEEKKKIQQKKGFSFGALPTISYDADMGLQYGGLVNVFDYGDGTLYPDYRQMAKVEISRYTKGSGVNQIFYDAKHLLPYGIRVSADLSYLTERKLDFFGFNGYQSFYNKNFVDDESAEYLTRVFYAHERKLFRFTADFQGNLPVENLHWLAGFGFMNVKVATVDIAKLNKGKNAGDQLPDTATLFDKYVDWGLISDQEKDGGSANYLKAGLVYDTRDNEASATRGLWTEAFVEVVPSFLFNSEFSYTRLVFTHRQYFTLVKDKLSVAYRLGYQGLLGGDMPFFMYPLMKASYSPFTKTDGLGGARNLRGIMRNRAEGEGVAYGNVELRWKFLHTLVKKQNLDFSLHAFADAGMVVQDVKIDRSLISSEDQARYFDFSYKNDKLHPSAGLGLRIALNHNFILAVDYGFALKKQDGKGGAYINIGNLY